MKCICLSSAVSGELITHPPNYSCQMWDKPRGSPLARLHLTLKCAASSEAQEKRGSTNSRKVYLQTLQSPWLLFKDSLLSLLFLLSFAKLRTLNLNLVVTYSACLQKMKYIRSWSFYFCLEGHTHSPAHRVTFKWPTLCHVLLGLGYNSTLKENPPHNPMGILNVCHRVSKVLRWCPGRTCGGTVARIWFWLALFIYLFICLFVILGLHLQHMEVPRLGVQSEL